MVTEGGAPLVFQLPHQPGAELVAWGGEFYYFIILLYNGASAPAASPPRIADVDGRWQKRRRHERYWKDLEAILEVRGWSWGGWERSRGILGALGVSPGAFWTVLGSSWGRLGPSRGRLGRSWGRLGANLGRLGSSWGVLGESWAVLGASWGALGGRPGPLGTRLERNPCKSYRIYKNLQKPKENQ